MNDTVIHGDALSVLRGMADNSVDAIVSDPPAGIKFMGKDWDSFDTFPLRDRTKEASKGGFKDAKKAPRGMGLGFDGVNNSPMARKAFIAFLTQVMTEALRVLKPGGHALIWALPRTSHWTATALEDAGFEVRDKLYHLFGSGFPKSHNISVAIDKMQGAEREVIYRGDEPGREGRKTRKRMPQPMDWGNEAYAPDNYTITKPATPEAAQYAGYGTALKPSCEEWILVRKPLAESSIAAQVLATGTGGLAIDACRVGNDTIKVEGWRKVDSPVYGQTHKVSDYHGGTHQGRYPSTLLLSHSLWCVPRGTKRVRGTHPHKVPIQTTGNRTDGWGYGANIVHDYIDSEGMETVEAYDCAPGGVMSVSSYAYNNCDVWPFSEPLYLLDQLSCVLQGLPQYSKAYNTLWLDASESVHNEGKQPFWLDVQQLNDLRAVAHGLGVSRFANSLFDCPSCLHLCGEYAHRLVTAYQDGLPSLDGVLSDVCRQLVSHVHNPHCQYPVTGMVRLLVFLAFDILSHVLPDIISQNTVDINTSPCPIAELDRQSGVRKSTGGFKAGSTGAFGKSGIYSSANGEKSDRTMTGYGDSGTVSRYFTNFPPDDYTPYIYQSKASRAERNRGCEDLPLGANRINAPRNNESEKFLPTSNHHPTVKPLQLMRWLIRLITPPDGIVLDPFCGSGSTCVAAIQEGKHFIGIEQDASYVAICEARIAHAQREQGVTVQAQEYDCAPDCPVRILGEQSGTSKSSNTTRSRITPHAGSNGKTMNGGWNGQITEVGYGDSGNAARYFQQFAPDLWTQDMQDAEDVFIAEGGYEDEVPA